MKNNFSHLIKLYQHILDSKNGGVDSRWYVHVLSLLASMCIGTCMYQPLNSLYRLHVPRYVLSQKYVNIPRSVQRYVHKPEQTYLIHKFIKFGGCLEAASERTNVPLSSAQTWTPFHLLKIMLCKKFR